MCSCMCVHVCVFMYVCSCMCVHVCVCMYVCVHVCAYVKREVMNWTVEGISTFPYAFRLSCTPQVPWQSRSTTS